MKNKRLSIEDLLNEIRDVTSQFDYDEKNPDDIFLNDSDLETFPKLIAKAVSDYLKQIGHVESFEKDDFDELDDFDDDFDEETLYDYDDE